MSKTAKDSTSANINFIVCIVRLARWRKYDDARRRLKNVLSRVV
jgi:hypothetical protein